MSSLSSLTQSYEKLKEKYQEELETFIENIDTKYPQLKDKIVHFDLIESNIIKINNNTDAILIDYDFIYRGNTFFSLVSYYNETLPTSNEKKVKKLLDSFFTFYSIEKEERTEFYKELKIVSTFLSFLWYLWALFLIEDYTRLNYLDKKDVLNEIANDKLQDFISNINILLD